jgi:hypothetical protein
MHKLRSPFIPGLCCVFALACGPKPNNLGNSDDVVLNGSLAVSGTARDTSPANFKLYCVTFTDPPIAGSGTASSAGDFSLTLKGAANKSFGCFVEDPNGKTVATVQFSDPSATSLSGGATQQSSISLSGTVNLSSIAVDPKTGVASVDLSKIQQNGGTLTVNKGSGAWDFTGTWVLSDAPSLPDGYSKLCAAGATDCFGPQAGQSVYLQRISGKPWVRDAACKAAADNHTFNPPATCGGSDGTGSFYGITAWASQAAFNLCGAKMGIDAESAKAYGLVDLSAGTIAGPLTFATTVKIDNVDQMVTDGWKFSGATASHAINDPAAPQSAPLIAQGALCSSVGGQGASNALSVASLQCYADYYQNHARSLSGCIADVSFNWAANMPGNFIEVTGPQRSISEFALEVFQYTGDGSGSFVQERSDHRGLSGQGGQYTSCGVTTRMVMNMNKTSDTTAVGDMQQTTFVNDSRPECLTAAAATSFAVGTSKALFKMTKQ